MCVDSTPGVMHIGRRPTAIYVGRSKSCLVVLSANGPSWTKAMPAAPHLLRLPFKVDPDPVNGYVLVRCENLDLVSQGKNEADARAVLSDEASLYLAAARDLGTMDPLVERLAEQTQLDGLRVLDIDLAKLP